MDVTILIFLLVYVAMGLGKLPGFKVDRTGAAVVGALAMMIAGTVRYGMEQGPWRETRHHRRTEPRRAHRTGREARPAPFVLG